MQISTHRVSLVRKVYARIGTGYFTLRDVGLDRSDLWKLRDSGMIVHDGIRAAGRLSTWRLSPAGLGVAVHGQAYVPDLGEEAEA